MNCELLDPKECLPIKLDFLDLKHCIFFCSNPDSQIQLCKMSTYHKDYSKEDNLKKDLKLWCDLLIFYAAYIKNSRYFTPPEAL